MIRDLTDDEARAALPLKWETPGVVPAWVAEMDYRQAEPITEALVDAVRRGALGYPPHGDDLGAAFSGFAARHWGWEVGPEASMPTGGVMSGIRIALEVLCPPGPVVVPMPCYPPFRDVVAVTGRELVPVPLDPDSDDTRLDLAAVSRSFAAGARTLLLCNPHNPLGHVPSREELAALAALAREYDARVISDEIHAPLVLDGATMFTPYLTVDDRAIVVTSASKTFNMPATHGAQLVLPEPADRERLAAVPIPAQNTWSALGVVAGTVAWRDCDDWLDALRGRLSTQRGLLVDLVADRLPKARMRPLRATYLAWLDLRDHGVADPAAAALAHGVRVAPGHDYQPGLDGHVRVNIATSPDRLEQVVDGLAAAVGTPG
ncbi:aminotransferase class I/II-fold pyridoxal phosphate-dependent enzyme [Nocardioides sp. YIM 152315]|uniref:MalY/PatB family protein n=1 Tax=Nocardioides sp. YIM 152315 TaxID=3031760 RepID=UPI0023DAD2AE|nr:aminotransferase class I/II-fold pyridoxal phosphate-dependent enzyme [Nocardioides sp. YIM 152315]MDF1604356.1 aminotransferase class I/II-fold pyridoxal phosphate-dependent enzyme [Nocardioides sp. YIM 152315]